MITLFLHNIWLHNCNGSKKSAVPKLSSRGGDETAEASDVEGHFGDSASKRGCAQSTSSRPEKDDAEAYSDVEAGKGNTARQLQKM